MPIEIKRGIVEAQCGPEPARGRRVLRHQEAAVRLAQVGARAAEQREHLFEQAIRRQERIRELLGANLDDLGGLGEMAVALEFDQIDEKSATESHAAQDKRSASCSPGSPHGACAATMGVTSVTSRRIRRRTPPQRAKLTVCLP